MKPLGVPGYAGAKGAVPEPQGPTSEAGTPRAKMPDPDTSSGRRLLENILLERHGDGDQLDLYGVHQLVLAIEAEARAAVPLWDDPELDGTEGAHPAWWRGDDHGYERGRAAVPPDIDVLREVLRRFVDEYEEDQARPPSFVTVEMARGALSPDATRREPE